MSSASTSTMVRPRVCEGVPLRQTERASCGDDLLEGSLGTLSGVHSRSPHRSRCDECTTQGSCAHRGAGGIDG